MHDTRDTSTRTRRQGNGRTPAENHLFAKIGNRGLSPQQRLDAAEAMRKGRRDAAAERIRARLGPLPEDELEREIDREIADQMTRARAAALTGRRKAREAAEKAAQKEREYAAAAEDSLGLDASGLADCGSDGIDA
jgi:hypothetical protein